MLFSIGRLTTRRLVSTAFATRSVVFRATAKSIYPRAVRPFASATTAKKSAATVKKTAAAKPKAKTATAKKAVKASATKKSAKPAKKTTKRAVKAAPRANRAPPQKTSQQKERLLRRELKALALTTEPKRLPDEAWPLYLANNTRGKDHAIDRTPTLSIEYKALTPDQREQLIAEAKVNKATNKEQYKAWVETHTVKQTYDANNARRQLKKKFNIPKGKLTLIRDSRLPKRPTTSFLIFAGERWGAGDLQDTEVPKAGAKLGLAWQSLSETERQKYVDLAQVEIVKYREARKALGF